MAWNLAGGYRRDEAGGNTPVLATHRRTLGACAVVHGALPEVALAAAMGEAEAGHGADVA